MCGGTIINTRTVLTAAHCTYGHTANRWRTRVGSTFANSGGTVHLTYSIVIHPNFDRRTLDSDISIMRTTTNINYNNDVSPASMAGSNYNLPDNQVVWAAGWGVTAQGASLGSEQLRHVQIWTVNQSVCAQRYSEIGSTITPNMLCSGWLDVGGRDQCQGDSGGPLYHNGVVVGICSWGEGCAETRYPGVNTRVTHYTNWIQANA